MRFRQIPVRVRRRARAKPRPPRWYLVVGVLALPAEERRVLMAQVLATLDDGPAEDRAEVNAAWGDEIHRRIERRTA